MYYFTAVPVVGRLFSAVTMNIQVLRFDAVQTDATMYANIDLSNLISKYEIDIYFERFFYLSPSLPRCTPVSASTSASTATAPTTQPKPASATRCLTPAKSLINAPFATRPSWKAPTGSTTRWRSIRGRGRTSARTVTRRLSGRDI